MRWLLLLLLDFEKRVNLGGNFLTEFWRLSRMKAPGAVAELADAGDLKSPGLRPCGFESRLPHGSESGKVLCRLPPF